MNDLRGAHPDDEADDDDDDDAGERIYNFLMLEIMPSCATNGPAVKRTSLELEFPTNFVRVSLIRAIKCKSCHLLVGWLLPSLMVNA